MKKRILSTITLLTTIILANTTQEGKTLYLEAKCNKCHLQDSKFDPNSTKKEGLTSKVKSKKDLQKWVTDCNNYFSIGWFPEEEKEVATYLNAVYYKLDKKKEDNSTK